jgi:hypothetical protein
MKSLLKKGKHHWKRKLPKLKPGRTGKMRNYRII